MLTLLLNYWTSPAALSAFGSTALISLIPNLLLLLFPAFSNGASDAVAWQWGQCLAAGGLLGDVFLHTLPHILMQGEHGPDHHDHHHHEHDHNAKKNRRRRTTQEHHHHHQEHHHHHGHDDKFPMGLWILLGFFVFLLVDVVLRMVQEMADNDDDNDKNNKATTTGAETQQLQNNHDDTCNGGSADKNKIKPHSHHHHDSKRKKEWSLIVLNLTADALHNFTDGAAIGASYAAAAHNSTAAATALINPGSVATLSILLHEVPHELGDYCTLVGYFVQFGTAVAALLGTAVALLVAQSSSSSATDSHHDHDHHDDTSSGNNNKDALLLSTAGGFLYLAATTLLPHVLSEKVARPWHRLGHLVAFVLGVSFMYAVAWLEEAEHDHGHGHHHHEL